MVTIGNAVSLARCVVPRSTVRSCGPFAPGFQPRLTALFANNDSRCVASTTMAPSRGKSRDMRALALQLCLAAGDRSRGRSACDRARRGTDRVPDFPQIQRRQVSRLSNRSA
jgi:hypothetical protein